MRGCLPFARRHERLPAVSRWARFRSPMSDFPQDLMPAIAQALVGLDVVKPFEIKVTTGPILFVVVPGAAGDPTLAKEVQRKVTPSLSLYFAKEPLVATASR